MTKADEILEILHQHANAHNVAGMGRFGIDTSNALGISVAVLRKLAKSYRKDHELALQLWDSGIHEARLMAIFIDDPAKVTVQQFDEWSHEVNSWDLCDQMCMNLFSLTPFAEQKAHEYAQSEEEFVKRVAFALIATFALRRLNKDDEVLMSFLPVIERASDDSRNFVKKSVNWALRQIGKKNANLRLAATQTAERILQRNNKTARWIASDALREFNKKTV